MQLKVKENYLSLVGQVEFPPTKIVVPHHQPTSVRLPFLLSPLLSV